MASPCGPGVVAQILLTSHRLTGWLILYPLTGVTGYHDSQEPVADSEAVEAVILKVMAAKSLLRVQETAAVDSQFESHAELEQEIRRQAESRLERRT